jgi:hypothetical protein
MSGWLTGSGGNAFVGHVRNFGSSGRSLLVAAKQKCCRKVRFTEAAVFRSSTYRAQYPHQTLSSR